MTHNIDCKIDGFGAMKLKSQEFVKKILAMKLNYKFIFYGRVLLFLAAFTGYLEITKHSGFGMLLY